MRFWCVFKVDNLHGFGRQVSGLVENFNMGIFSDTINVINVKVCMMVVLTELYPFIPLSVTFIVFQDHSSDKQF